MSNNEILRLRDLTLTYELQPSDLLHVSQNGLDYAIRYSNFRNEVISDIPSQQPIWNARFIDSHAIRVDLPRHNDILIWDDTNKTFTHTQLTSENINFSSLDADDGVQRYITLSDGKMKARQVSIADISPRPNTQAGSFVAVNDNGDGFIEISPDDGSILSSPDEPINSVFGTSSGLHYVSEITNNKPNGSVNGFLLSARAPEITNRAAVLYFDTDFNKVLTTTHSGNTTNPAAYEPWGELYSSTHYPLSNGVHDNRPNALTTANIVYQLNEKIEEGINTLGTTLTGRVDSLDSSLVAHKSSGDHDNRYMRSDVPPTMNAGRGIVRFESNDRDNHNGAGITIRPTQNPQNGRPEETGSILSVRGNGNDLKFWVGMDHISLNTNTTLAKNIEAESIKLRSNRTNYTNSLMVHGNRTNNNEYANIQLINDSGNSVKIAAVRESNNDIVRVTGATTYTFDGEVKATNIKSMANRDIYISQTKPSNSIGNNGDVWYVWS